MEFGVKTDYIKDQSHFSSLNNESEFCKFQSYRQSCPAQEHFLANLPPSMLESFVSLKSLQKSTLLSVNAQDELGDQQ